MLPLLYNSNTAPENFFNNNGLGFIRNSTKCIASEERNGKYELDLEVLTSDRLSSCIVPGMFVKAKANPHDPPQVFEIYQTSANDKTITAKAHHLRYIAYGNAFRFLYQYSALSTEQDPNEIWQELTSPVGAYDTMLLYPNYFNFDSDITTKNFIRAGEKRLVRLGEFLQGIEGSMLDVFGGEFYFNNFNIYLLKSRGTNTGIAIRYGSNISSYQQDSDISTIYSHIMPYAILPKVTYEDGEDKAIIGEDTLYGTPVEITGNTLFYQRALPYDFSDKFTGNHDHIHISGVSGGGRPNEPELLEKLLTEANNYISENQNTLSDRTINITIDVASALETFKNCRLCDTVKVVFEPLGFTTNAKIVKTEYDCLNERYTKIELGTIKKNISDLFNVKNIGGA